jgi:penicillin V acylase-like amidase (Ntn superfamily)
MRYLLLPLTLLFAFVFFVSPAQPCSRILWNDNGRSVLVGRNMDWFTDLHSNIWVLPRGMQRTGLAAQNPLTWKSKYGSIAITGYDSVTADGLNEKKLAVHMLYLQQTSVTSRNAKTPGMCISLWAQYYLDNFATVAEAVEAWQTNPYQLLMAVEPTSKMPVTVHLALNDSTGDSAILEYIGGEMKIYHDRNNTVMTNEPPFAEQLKNLQQYEGFGGKKPLPGTNEPEDRFVRGAFYAAHLPKPKSDREAIASLMSVMRNVSGPMGASTDPERPNVSMTIWRTITDLSNGVLYYDGVLSPQVFWLSLNELNFDPNQPVRKLTVVDNFNLGGDVKDKLETAPMFHFLAPEESPANADPSNVHELPAPSL